MTKQIRTQNLQSPKNKLKNTKESGINFDLLIGLLTEKGISEQDAIDRINLPEMEPAKDFYRTVVFASRELQEKIRDKSLDVGDKYQASLLRFLEVGDKISKTINNAKLEAYPKEEGPEEGVPIGDL